MDIKSILDSLNIDFTNSEAKRGAIEALEAILASRAPIPSANLEAGLAGESIEVELDPDLLQPSIKQASTESSEDIEVEDEEDILSQVKHNDAEEPPQSTNTGEDSANTSETRDNKNSQSDSDEPADYSSTDEATPENDKSENSAENEKAVDSVEANPEKEINPEEATSDKAEASEDDKNQENETIDDHPEKSDENNENSEELPALVDDEDFDFDFDEEDLVDDELKKSTEDRQAKTKNDTRKIKRERTLAAAQKALADAKAKKVSPALIRELESAIAALETLIEAAASKSLKDISDAEFNQLINRVFDAIQACGDTELTFTSEEEREAQVKEIKDDLAKSETQNELSAEDIAKIRAETQAIKAREKETDKYKTKSASSFKGFQEFLSSLYRAIALQVHHEETRDDSWSALSHRNSGAGVLQPGKKIQDLPNKRIPVIDFYFDQSGSWTDDDIKIGEKAVQSLADMEANGQIKINVYYFSDSVFTDAASARALGGTRGWNEIVKNVIATQANNVVIMTDDDMENWWEPQRQPPLRHTIPGYVWYLWKNGRNAPRLPRDLRGRGGVQQFSFGNNDM